MNMSPKTSSAGLTDSWNFEISLPAGGEEAEALMGQVSGLPSGTQSIVAESGGFQVH